MTPTQAPTNPLDLSSIILESWTSTGQGPEPKTPTQNLELKVEEKRIMEPQKSPKIMDASSVDFVKT
jgi:hypothetical protein